MYKKEKSTRKEKPALTKELLTHLVNEHKLTDNDIAQETGYGHAYVSECRQKWGITKVSLYEKRVGNVKLDQFQKDCLIGTLLGKGAIELSSSDLASYTCGYSGKYLEYLRHNAHLFETFLTEKNKERIAKADSKVQPNGKYKGYKFRTRGHPTFNYYYQMFYREKEINNKLRKIKIFPRSLIKIFNSNHLAFWFLDDGRFESGGFTIGTILDIPMDLKTELIKTLWKKFSLNACFGKVSYLPSGRPTCALRILANSIQTFLKLLNPFIEKGLTQKIPSKFLKGEESVKKAILVQPKVVKRRFADGKIYETYLCHNLECDKEFEVPNASHQVYCSTYCRKAGEDARRREENIPKRTKTCDQCGDIFYDESFISSRKYCLHCRPLKD